MGWQGTLAWVLQVLGAVGAVWGLYSKDTSAVNPATQRRALTGRGWLALIGVMLGVAAFGVNQALERRKARAAETQRIAADQRAAKAEQTLQQVETLQGSLRDEQVKQLEVLRDQAASQARQIEYLNYLALAQQQLRALELRWRAMRDSEQRVAKSFKANRERERRDGKPDWRTAGQNVYLETCLMHGEIVLARRANYSWRLDCKVARPQGMLPVTFEIPADSDQARTVDAFIDAILSPEFSMVTKSGNRLFEFSAANRPKRISRDTTGYVIYHDEFSARLNVLNDGPAHFEMQFSSGAGLPAAIRVKSLDPLVKLDEWWTTGWRAVTVGKVFTMNEPGEEPIAVDRVVMKSAPHPLNVSFGRLLFPAGGARQAAN